MFRTLSIGYLYCEHRLATQDYTTFFGMNINCHQIIKIIKDFFYFLFALLLSIIKCIAQLQKMQKASLHAQ